MQCDDDDDELTSVFIYEHRFEYQEVENITLVFNKLVGE